MATLRAYLRALTGRLGPVRARFWLVLLPIHLTAFAVLYVGTIGLLGEASSRAGATAARFQLDQAVQRMPFLWMGKNPHILQHLVVANQGIGLRLYSRTGRPVQALSISPDPAEIARVRAFLGGRESSASWVEAQGEREFVRGVVRITGSRNCLPCHADGETLGAATMKLDYTAQLRETRDELRDRVGLLVGVWITLLAVVTVVVQRTVSRSGARLREELAGAGSDAAGEPADGAGLPLDPVAAEVHRSLRDLLRRQRERETQVATRLARVDQLASLGQLAAGLAHEIKNPLAGIQGALEVLRDDDSKDDNRILFGEMLGELERVNTILQRLLESGRPAPLRLARMELPQFLGDTAELMRPSLRRRKVVLDVETAEGLPALQVDPAKLRQVLLNLIQNAAEAMGDAGGRIAVRASAFPNEAAVVLAVEDDGPGMPPETLNSIFEPFFTTKFAGTGLGLAISKSLVEQHGGRIEVSSEVGRGTTFLIILPERAASGGSAEAS